MPGEVCEAVAKYSFLIYANEIIYGNNETRNWVRKTREEIKTGK